MEEILKDLPQSKHQAQIMSQGKSTKFFKGQNIKNT